MKLEVVDRIDAVTLAGIVDDFRESDRYQQFIENNDYFKGQNTSILRRKTPSESGAPDNRIPVPYGRRIINLVSGYMYKPGLVSYASVDEKYFDVLTNVFDANSEPIKTEQMGKQTSIQGIGYEFHYVQGDREGNEFRATPRFIKLPAAEVVPIYDYAVEPNLWSFVRIVTRGDKDIAWIYYKNIWEQFDREKDGGKNFVQIGTGRHYYGEVPLVVYQNNEEEIGDFEPVQHLIDAYDVLVSDSMNEFDRFAYAYLVMKGLGLSPEAAAELKKTRTFENLDQEDSIEFLTKDMATEYVKFMTDLIRDEIHRQSGIPNLEDYDAAGASGATMTKFIYLMELFTDPKESYFKQGLSKRIELIDRVLRYSVDPGRVEIIMSRNTPDASKEQAEIFNLYSGHVSEETLLNNFADFVEDAAEEIEKLTAEKELNVERYMDIAGEPDDESGEDSEERA